MTIQRIAWSPLLLSGCLLLTTTAHAASPDNITVADTATDATLIARGGGRAGGGVRGGSAGRPSGGFRGGQTGFQGAGAGLNRGDQRPSGGWSTRVPDNGMRPEVGRPGGTRDGNRDQSPGRGGGLQPGGDRDFDRGGGRDRNPQRDWNRTVNINNVNVHPGWARPGWGVARPWSHDWYGGWNSPPWGWWGARAAAWGIGTLATAAIINDAVNDAIDDQVSYIVVPGGSYQLLYGSVAPVGNQTVSFAVTSDGTTYQLTADCQSGTLNGQTPGSAAEAQLLNAACQVAFGSA